MINCSDCKNNGTQICSVCCSYQGYPDRWEAKPKTNADRICECAVKWTPTIEECPLQSGNYLIVVNNAVEIEYFSTVMGWDCDGVTHWAPLPELPQSGEHKEEKMSGLIKFERYKLVLRHEFVDGENVCEIEKPIVVQYCVDRSCRGSSIIVNEMIEKLRHHMLSVIEEEVGT